MVKPRVCLFFFVVAAFQMSQALSPAQSPAPDWQGSLRALLSEKNHSGAARLLEKLLPDHEKDYAFLNLLATTLERAGRISEATAFYERALSLRPQSSTIRLNLALGYVRLGQMPRASAEFTRLLKEAPVRPPRAAAYQQSEDDTAMHAFVSAVPARERDWYELGMLFLRHGRTRGAQTILEAAARIFPDSAQMHYGLGWALQEGSRFEAAKQAFARALELQPVFPEAAVRLGYAHYIQGAYADGIRVYRRLLDSNPESYEANYFLAQALARIGGSDVETAIQHFQKAITLNPASFDSHLELGSLYLKTGKLAAARNELELARHISPDQERTHYLLAQVYAATGENSLAQKELSAFQDSRRRERERARRQMEADLLGEFEPSGTDPAAKALEFIEAYKARLLSGDYLWIWRRLTPSSRELYDDDAEQFVSVAGRVFGTSEIKERMRQMKLEGGKRVAGRIFCEFVAHEGVRIPPLVLIESEGELKIDYAFEWTSAGLGYLGAR